MQMMVADTDRGIHNLIRKLPIKIGTRIRLIDLMNIMYVHACGDYVDLVMLSGETLHTKEQITRLQNRLPSYLFSRVHRSYIVNTNYVQEIRTRQNDYDLILSNGTAITSGSVYRQHVRERFLSSWANGLATFDARVDGDGIRVDSRPVPEDTGQDVATGLRIRIGAPGDEHSLSLLGQLMFMEGYVGLLAEQDILAHCASCHTPGFYRASLEDPKTRIWVLETEDAAAPVGYLMLTPANRSFTGRPDDELEIQRIYLLDRHRGKGWSTRLLAEALQYAKVKRCSRLWATECEKNERALKFYEHAGFRATNEVHVRMGSREFRDLVLSLET